MGNRLTRFVIAGSSDADRNRGIQAKIGNLFENPASTLRVDALFPR
jgi:hypothetical protein